MYGASSPDDLVGMDATLFIAPSSRDRAAENLRRRLSGEEVPDVEYELVRVDGSTFYGELAASAVPGPGGAVEGYLYLTRDTTERRRAGDLVRREEERYKLIFRTAPIAINITRGTDVLWCNPAYLEMFGLSSLEEMASVAPLGLFAPESLAKVRENIIRRASGLAVPDRYEVECVRTDGSTFPVLLQFSRANFPDGPATVAFITDMSGQKRAETEAILASARLEVTLEGAVSALGAATELRDPYTAGHQRRAAELACAIAARVGTKAARIALLRTAALLHDVGKIVVPAEILSKPGRLSEIEMKIIRQHPGMGADIVRPIGFDPDVAHIVCQHHERLDGSGYPAGLTGPEILPEALVLAVADVVEAMISHRPYRPGLPVEAAVAELEAGAGVLYDATACAAAISLVSGQGFQFSQ
jgi:PAS domain S-box-containing protein/putative nucleotidyltransferase with HDIG domain